MKPARTQSTLPRRLELELRDAAKTEHADEAVRWMERYERARAEGQTAEARRAAVRAKQVAPRAPSVREALGLSAFAEHNWHEAAQELLTWRRLTGKRIHDPVIAECYRQEGRPERAHEFLADLPPDVPPRTALEAAIVRARSLADSGRLDAARATLESAARSAGPTVRARLKREADELSART